MRNFIPINIEKPLTVYQSKDYSHGRYVIRTVSVFNDKNINHKNYLHLQSFIQVERIGFRGEQEYKETIYYISSEKLNVEIFAEILNLYRSIGFISIKKVQSWLGNNWEKILAIT